MLGHTTKPVQFLWVVAALLGITLASSAIAQKTGSAAATREINLPAGSLARALDKLTDQAGVQIMYETKLTDGIQVGAVRGTLTLEAALAQLLSNTGLRVETVHDKMVVLKRGNRSTSAADSGDQMRLADNKTGVPEPAAQSSADGSQNGAGEMVVKDTRLGRQVQGAAPRGENEAIYFEVIDRDEIEKYGVTDLDELLRRIPQVSNYGTGEQSNVTNITIGSGGPGINLSSSTVNFRGARSTRTAVLLNGRRLTRASATGGIDTSRIPLAAVERIEILPAAASALYGGGAVGGAINIITRSEYHGRDLTLNYGMTTEGGGSNVQATYIEGWSLRGGKTSGTLTFNVSRQEELHVYERDFIRRALDRIQPDTGFVDASGRSVYEAVMIPAFPGAPGTIVLNSATGGLGIPGNPTARYAGVPTGQDGTGLTPASFTATAGRANLGMRLDRSLLIRPSEKASFNLSLENQFIKDRLTLYVDAMMDVGKYWGYFPSSVASVSLSATDPRNPFRKDATPGFVGRPVTLYYDPIEVSDSYAEDEKLSGHLVVGLKGKLPHGWNWAWDVSGDKINSRISSVNNVQGFRSLIHTSLAAHTADPSRWNIYNPLRDHTAFPMNPADVARYFGVSSTFYSPKYTGATNLQLDGRVLTLPAGELRTSLGGELNWWVNETGASWTRNAPEYARILNLQDTSRPAGGQDLIRRLTRSVQGEVRVPVFSERWHPVPGMRTLELVGSTRLEEVAPKRSAILSDVDIDPKRATTSAIALKFVPLRDVAIRVGFTEGFVQQDDFWLNEDPNPVPFNLTELVADPLRGNVLTSTTIPLVAGIVDRFAAAGLRCFGPTAAAAQLEGSKAYTKEFLRKYKIPTAAYATFTRENFDPAYVKAHRTPIVVKASGLAAGKGVVIASTTAEALETIEAMFAGRFGDAGREVVIEEFLEGEEASFIVMADGRHVLPFATSQDHKRRDDGDKGPNTGGMGAYSPAPVVTPSIHARVMREVIEPTIQGLIQEGSPFVGFLYAGLMIAPDGTPKVIEFNCRFGDPEAQPVLSRLKSDLIKLCGAAVDGTLDKEQAEWDSRAALGVVMAAGGYPDSVRKGDVIEGLEDAASLPGKVFHAGTAGKDGKITTNGGRVLCAVGLGSTITEARHMAYALLDRIRWPGLHYRKDIGHRALPPATGRQ